MKANKTSLKRAKRCLGTFSGFSWQTFVTGTECGESVCFLKPLKEEWPNPNLSPDHLRYKETIGLTGLPSKRVNMGLLSCSLEAFLC